MRHGTLRDKETEEVFQKFILNKEVFWFPWVIDGLDVDFEMGIPPLKEIVKGLLGKGVPIKQKFHVNGVDQKLLEQFMCLIHETKKEEQRLMEKAKKAK